jgi:hypothetical protein
MKLQHFTINCILFKFRKNGVQKWLILCRGTAVKYTWTLAEVWGSWRVRLFSGIELTITADWAAIRLVMCAVLGSELGPEDHILIAVFHVSPRQMLGSFLKLSYYSGYPHPYLHTLFTNRRWITWLLKLSLNEYRVRNLYTGMIH